MIKESATQKMADRNQIKMKQKETWRLQGEIPEAEEHPGNIENKSLG